MRPVVISLLLLALVSPAFANPTTQPIVSKDVIFEETGGMPAVEAEFFTKQTMNDIRAWYRITADETPGDTAGRDVDPAHLVGASNNAYLEILPDTRTNHGEKLINGENFASAGGTLALLHYPVYFNTPGRYYVWVRADSTGSEDNGIHVGIDGTWPESGQRMHWCEGKHTWRWESKQRTEENHCGEPYKIYLDVDDPEATYNALASVINDSSADNPLFLIAGGPMQVVGEGIHRAEPDRRKHVTLISHSVWNNEHSDAGMIIYLLTGVEETEAPMARSIMETPAGN